MLYCTNYVIKPKQSLIECTSIEADFLEILCESVIFENSQGGISAWNHEDYVTLVKILFLASFKNEYEHPFLTEAPLSEKFFDTWWQIEHIPEKITRKEAITDWGTERLSEWVPTSSDLVNEYLKEMAKPNSPKVEGYTEKKYRVFWDGDVIGWLKEPIFSFPFLEGDWSHTVNPKGKEFKKSFAKGEQYEVIIEGYPVYKAKLEVINEKAKLEILSDIF